jgi:hypothetical protein
MIGEGKNTIKTKRGHLLYTSLGTLEVNNDYRVVSLLVGESVEP